MTARLPDDQLTRARKKTTKVPREADVRVPLLLTQDEADRLDVDRGKDSRSAYIRSRLFGPLPTSPAGSRDVAPAASTPTAPVIPDRAYYSAPATGACTCGKPAGPHGYGCKAAQARIPPARAKVRRPWTEAELEEQDENYVSRRTRIEIGMDLDYTEE